MREEGHVGSVARWEELCTDTTAGEDLSRLWAAVSAVTGWPT
jgi:hypothetical protein